MYQFKTTQSNLLKYNGVSCIVLSEISSDKYDKSDVGTMYNIKLENGIEIEAFKDELI